MRRRNPSPEWPSVDLHGATIQVAMRRLSQALHGARVRGARGLLVITGRGIGTRDGQPVLRSHVEDWLRSPEARSLGIRGHRRVSKGGALEVTLGDPRPTED